MKRKKRDEEMIEIIDLQKRGVRRHAITNTNTNTNIVWLQIRRERNDNYNYNEITITYR
jgi:hypothetical protein